MSSPDGRLTVGIVGAGRVGPVLGAALAGAGHLVESIAAVSQASVERAAALLPGVPVRDVPEVVAGSELVVLAVPDDQVGGLVQGLHDTGVWRSGQIVVHTSPRFGTGILDPALHSGALPLAIHPVMAFTGTSMDLARLRESYIAVTGPTPLLPIGQALAVEMGGEPVVIPEDAREAYAEAIATATDFSRAIVAQATALLQGRGIEPAGGILAPLFRSSVDNALRSSGDVMSPDEHLWSGSP